MDFRWGQFNSNSFREDPQVVERLSKVKDELDAALNDAESKLLDFGESPSCGIYMQLFTVVVWSDFASMNICDCGFGFQLAHRIAIVGRTPCNADK